MQVTYADLKGFVCTSRSKFSFLSLSVCRRRQSFKFHFRKKKKKKKKKKRKEKKRERKKERKMQRPGAYGYGQLITEYLINDMMKYDCLRVSIGDVRRIGKYSYSLS